MPLTHPCPHPMSESATISQPRVRPFLFRVSSHCDTTGQTHAQYIELTDTTLLSSCSLHSSSNNCLHRRRHHPARSPSSTILRNPLTPDSTTTSNTDLHHCMIPEILHPTRPRRNSTEFKLQPCPVTVVFCSHHFPIDQFASPNTAI